jgi:hypothetical protein
VIEESTKKPLPGASIVIKGTAIGTVSDIDGTFTLVDPNPTVNQSTGTLCSTIVISFVGLKTTESEISSSRTSINNAKFTFLMQDAVILIENDTYIGAIPPPPPPKAKKSNSPPQPSPLKKGEKEQEVFFIVEDMPKYPGGHAALQKYIQKMQKEFAQSDKIRGKVLIGFTVNQKGKVADIKILNLDDLQIEFSENKKGNINNAQVIGKRNPEAEKAAVEIVMNMEDWSPGKQRGKAVPVKFMMPIEFK